jgi:negative regulator of flagellin synthesis FlgM
MRVSGKTGGVGVSQVAGGKPAGAGQSPATAGVGAADAVSVSSSAQFVASVTARLAQVPDIRTEKVEALKAKLDSDDYNPDPEAVADGLVREHMPPHHE